MGVGSDALAGNAGDDTYVVDDPGDMIVENAGDGTDTVKSNLSYVVGARLEHLVLTGTAVVNGTGNYLGNTLTGNSFLNIRGLGDDTLIGNAGNDYLDGATEADQLDPDELWFSRMGDDLKIAVLGAADGITLQKWYSGPEYRVEEFHTADGAVLYESQVQQLVQAMAAFNPPGAGESELSPPMREQLEPALAAAWET